VFPSHIGTEAGFGGATGGLASVSVITCPPQAVSTDRTKMRRAVLNMNVGLLYFWGRNSLL
jgi:hypothetical protein